MNGIVIKYTIAFVFVFVLTFIEEIDLLQNPYVVISILALLVLNLLFISEQNQLYSLLILYVNIIILALILYLIHHQKSSKHNSKSNHSLPA